ncbi:MAG TPA: cache domain-containing protein, partial [Dyella sp.]|uniref:cache domain-containing protein n=1 Tax=Dyella sp. TaxID=1869338 RepID=UPI002F925176
MGIFRWFGRTSLNARVWLVLLTVATGLAGLTVVSEIESRDVQMAALGDSLHDQVQSAIAIADDYRRRAATGEMSEADARKLALREIQAMRWDEGTGYIFAFDSDAKLLMHPLRTKDIGKSIRDDTDAQGFHHYAAMLSADREVGYAMTRYIQLMPDSKATKPKISYSEWYKPWNIHFVSGAYFDHIDAAFHAQLVKSLLRAAGIATVVVLLVWLSMRSIKSTIGGEPADAMRMAENIAQGDLRSDSLPAAAEGSLMHALQGMRTRLADIVVDVQRGAGMVTLTAQQIAQGNDDLSHRTQEQASSLEETAASMEEMTATVKQNAENALQADQLTRAARTQAERGGEVA